MKLLNNDEVLTTKFFISAASVQNITTNSTVSQSPETVNNTIPPLVFPPKGFTTLKKTVEKLPSVPSNENSTIEKKFNITTPNPNAVANSGPSTSQSVIANRLVTTVEVNTQGKTTQATLSVKPTDTEVSDLQNVPTKNPKDVDLLPVSPTIIYNANSKPDQGVILIDNGENTEDEIKAQKTVYHEPHVALVQGRMAAILAGVFLCVSVVGYIAMLSWRHYLE